MGLRVEDLGCREECAMIPPVSASGEFEKSSKPQYAQKKRNADNVGHQDIVSCQMSTSPRRRQRLYPLCSCRACSLAMFDGGGALPCC
jgi:hypothetical protein